MGIMDNIFGKKKKEQEVFSDEVGKQNVEQNQYEVLVKEFFPDLDKDIAISKVDEEVYFCTEDLTEQIEVKDGIPIVTENMVVSEYIKYLANRNKQLKMMLGNMLEYGNVLINKLIALESEAKSIGENPNHEKRTVELELFTKCEAIRRELSNIKLDRQKIRRAIDGNEEIINGFRNNLRLLNGKEANDRNLFSVFDATMDGECKKSTITIDNVDYQVESYQLGTGEESCIGSVTKFIGEKYGAQMSGLQITFSGSENKVCLMFEDGNLVFQKIGDEMTFDTLSKVLEYDSSGALIPEAESVMQRNCCLGSEISLRRDLPCEDNETGKEGKSEKIIFKLPVTRVEIDKTIIFDEDVEHIAGFKSHQTQDGRYELIVDDNGIRTLHKDLESNPFIRRQQLSTYLSEETTERVFYVSREESDIVDIHEENLRVFEGINELSKEKVKRKKKENSHDVDR